MQKFSRVAFQQKWQNTPFTQKFQQNFQQNAHVLKLFRKIPLFWNSIFRKSIFNEKLDFVKIKLLEKNYMELEFHVAFFFSLIAYNLIF